MKRSCEWPGENKIMIEYHDTEWGVPLHDDRKLFELFMLDNAQAGLSWQTIRNHWKNLKDIPATSTESDTMSKALKKRGFKFVGSTICYAFMQSVGMVNDHLIHCYRYPQCG